ncbi:MAG: hypothetical protein OER98_13645 [Gammaproteobacteria bacterium]|nr:hypothetical protein [Gammaproteobacteria bacterium]
MQKTNYCNAGSSKFKGILLGLLLAAVALPGSVWSAQQAETRENLSGFYSRDGNNGSPAKAAGNNIYIKFFENRWLGMMFVPYPYAIEVDVPVIAKVFKAARKQASSAAFLRGKYELLSEPATIQIERYGYLEDRIVFECGSLSPCTIKLGDGFLELIKPGVINEHIIRYSHVATP